MKYNRSDIMKAAWKMIREQGMTRSAALRLAWAQAKAEKEGKSMKESVIKKLVEMGATRWTKGEHDRLYLNNAAHKLIGFEIVDIYKSSGRISLARFNGRTISNSYATDIANSLRNIYIDLGTNQINYRCSADRDVIGYVREAIANLNTNTTMK